MQEDYQVILFHYVAEGGEPDLERAYDYGRQAIDEGVSILQVMDTHYEALGEVLQRANSVEESITIVHRAAGLLKEALGPFEMMSRGYRDTIDALRSKNEKLVKLIEERSQLLQQREDFMLVLTHDLKAPITAANRCLSLMLEGDLGVVSPLQIEVLTSMRDSNQQMFTMLKNLLEVYKYDESSPPLFLTKVDVRSCITAVVKAFSSSAQMRKLSLAMAVPEDQKPVLADEMAIQHVLTNLVDNAMKFTPEGGVITLSACNLDSKVSIQVSDTGRGIGEEDQTKLFQRFFQAASGRRQYTGTGLGLYLCKQIVNGHGGDIRCESELGAGTTFYLQLPQYKSDEK